MHHKAAWCGNRSGVLEKEDCDKRFPVDSGRDCEGLRVPDKQDKRRRLGTIMGAIMRRRAERILDVWSYDLVLDQTDDGRCL